MQSEADESWLDLEEQCLEALNSEPDYEREYGAQRDSAIRNVWGAFQDSATSIAHLYRDRSARSDTGALWLPFQTAAGTVTTLYKESCEGIKRTSEVAVQCGYQRRTREIADWARSKRRRYIRRDDLLAYLAGKPPPPSFHHMRGSHPRLSPKPETHLNNSSNPFLVGSNTMPNESTDLHTFKEALVRRPRGPELYAFVASEIARHCKRPASPLDVNMDVQNYSSKRQRFM